MKLDRDYSSVNNATKASPERLRRFLWWCAGADVATMQECSTDHTRYSALGMMVLVVPFVASVSFAFFLTQSFAIPTYQATTVGCVWGLFVIFPLERLILTFHRKSPGEFRRAFPRLILAVSLAFLIGDPVLTRLFQGEIELELARKGQAAATNAYKLAEDRFHEENVALQETNRDLQKRIDDLKAIRDEKESAVIGEIEGRVGSRIKGDGPAARQKEQAFYEAKAAYEQARSELLPKIDENNKRLTQIRTAIDEETKRLSDTHSAARGIIARHEALMSIIKQEPSTALTYVPLFLILGMLEVAPIINKLFFPPTEYDKQLSLREKNAIDQAIRHAALEREKQKRRVALLNNVAKEISSAVNNNDLANLVQPKRELGELLQATVLDTYRNDILSQAVKQNGSKRFESGIRIEIENRPDLQVRLEVPPDVRSSITLIQLDEDVQRIAEEVAAGRAQLFELVAVTTSSGRKVHRELPLLPQLQKDQTLRMAFAPRNDSTDELPIA